MFPLFPASRRCLLPLLVLLTGVSSAFAQRRDLREGELSCARSGGDRDGERACLMVQRTIAAPSGTLSVDSRLNGGISVIGENRSAVLIRAKVEAHARSEGRALELAEAVRVTSEGGRISVEGPDTRNREWWSVSFEVHVPARTDLQLRAHNGGIAVAAVRGTLRLETSNGGIHLDAVNGDVVAETLNGGLHIDLEGDRWEGRGLDASSTNGGVRLRVPEGYSAHLETGTVNGGVDIDFPVTVRGRLGRRITTDLGRGGATLRVVTTNGGVTVTRD